VEIEPSFAIHGVL